MGNVAKREIATPAWQYASNRKRFFVRRRRTPTSQLPNVIPEMNATSMSVNEYVEDPRTGISRRTHVTSYIIAARPESPATATAAETCRLVNNKAGAASAPD